MDDPFLLDQNRVESQLENVRRQFQRWRQLRDTDLQLLNDEEREEIEEEFHSLTAELGQQAKSIGWDLDDLQETLQMMLEAKAPPVAPAAVRESRAAFLAKSRSLLDEVAREVAMATSRVLSAAAATTRTSHGGGGEGQFAVRAVADSDSQDLQHQENSRPLLAWRKDSEHLSFPSVELNSLRDMRNARFYNRDWTGCFYRHRYLLAALTALCLVVFLVVVILAARHTAAGIGAGEWPGSTTVPPGSATTTECRDGWFQCKFE